MATLGEAALNAIYEAIRETLPVFALDLAGRAIEDAPVMTGRLRGSASPGGDPVFGGSPTVEVQEPSPGEFVVEVTFSTPYAHAQHEGYIDYGPGQDVFVRAHTRTLSSGRVVSVRAHTATRRGIVRFRHYPLGGGKKFLEKNLKAMAPRYEAALAAAIERKLSELKARRHDAT